MKTRLGAVAVAAALAVALAGCASTEPAESPATPASPTGAAGDDGSPTASTTGQGDSMQISSADFADGEPMPPASLAAAFGGQCDGDNVSPELSWGDAPDGTAAFAVTVIDIDAGGFVHGLLTDVSGDTMTIAAGGFDSAGVVGAHDAGGVGYFGPCPPSGVHRYEFTLYALDEPLALSEGFRMADLATLLDDHSLDSATVTGTVDAG